MGFPTPSIFFFFIILALILISLSPVPADAEANHPELIAELCNNTIDKAGCLSVLSSYPPFSKAKNYLDLSRVALKLAIRKGRETRDFLKGLLKRNIHSQSIKYCAFFCYDGVVGSFRSALAELPEDFHAANYDAKVAGDGAHNCEIELALHGILNHAVSSRNNETLLLSSITFAATGFLIK